MRWPWHVLRDLAARRRTGDGADAGVLEDRPDTVDVRIAAGLFEEVRAHVEDFSRGEEAGFLICSGSRVETGHVLLAREWHPIPEAAIARYAGGSVLSWTADFNSRVLQRAVDLDGTPVLVHSHGSPSPRFSSDDRAKERRLFGAFSRILEPLLPTGTLLLGVGDAVGSFWLAGMNDLRFHRLVVIGDSIDTWLLGGVPAATSPAPTASRSTGHRHRTRERPEARRCPSSRARSLGWWFARVPAACPSGHRCADTDRRRGRGRNEPRSAHGRHRERCRHHGEGRGRRARRHDDRLVDHGDPRAGAVPVVGGDRGVEERRCRRRMR